MVGNYEYNKKRMDNISKRMVGDYEYNKLKAQLAILEDVVKEYPTSSVPNAIQQIKSRIKHIEENGN